MYRLNVESHFDAAHRLYDYEGKCARLHGHTWRVQVTLAAPELDGRGMVCDFFDIDRALAEALAPFDHVVVNEVPPFDRISPTAENLARYIFDRMHPLLAGKGAPGARLTEVRVYESGDSWASYSADVAG